MLLDTFATVYVWIGDAANQGERTDVSTLIILQLLEMRDNSTRLPGTAASANEVCVVGRVLCSP